MGYRMKITAGSTDITKETELPTGEHNIAITINGSIPVEARLKDAFGSFVAYKTWDTNTAETFNGKGEWQFFVPAGCGVVIYDR